MFLASPAAAEAKFVIAGPAVRLSREAGQWVGRGRRCEGGGMEGRLEPPQVAGGEGLLPAVHVPRDWRHLLCSALRPWPRCRWGKGYRGTVRGPGRHLSQSKASGYGQHLVVKSQPGALGRCVEETTREGVPTPAPLEMAMIWNQERSSQMLGAAPRGWPRAFSGVEAVGTNN